MNNQDQVETEVSPYIPSARKSIHHHEHCLFSNRENMGRYGLNAQQDERNLLPSRHEQGTDEVDNVMSKYARQTSPVPVRQKRNKKKNRRNSLSVSNQECTDDDDSDSNLLAKSLPANLPSYYCSDDFAHQSLPSDFFKVNNSTSFSETRTRTQIHRNEEYNSFESQSEDYSITKKSTPQKTKSCNYMLLLFGVVCAIAAFYYNDITEAMQGKNSIHNYNQVNFKKDMNYLGEKYKINDNSILEVQSGISTILERNDTGSFIFVYNSRSVDFDIAQFINFVEDTAATAARYLRNDSTAVQPTVIHSSELNMQSHSELMNEYRLEVAKTGVMLVKDIDRIPSSLAMAFHYFCDEYNPLVAKSAIFFTLNLEQCSNISEPKSTHNEIEKCLAKKWSSVPKDNIKPLLSRVVNVIIDVTGV
ncbi:hypothetical protein ABMA28_012196 [Loxostege sticticalis]|uniref:Uncharacterized protein n=1 Tax=Loxostege sticticalis TaxID=481309 RepID=A0ABD0TM44_LOXSC